MLIASMLAAVQSCIPHNSPELHCARLEVTDITTTSAKISLSVLCKSPKIIDAGIFWGASANPEIDGTRVSLGNGIYEGQIELTCLTPGTEYLVKPYIQTAADNLITGAVHPVTTAPWDVFTDERDGRTYKVVTIGNQTWMAENLRYEVPGATCYDNLNANCDEYGLLYTWEQALAAVPAGWHMPSKEEVEILVSNFGSLQEAYNQLIVGGCSQFNGKFGGVLNHPPYSNYFGIELYGDFWTTTEQNPSWVWILDLNIYDQYAIIAGDRKARGFSLRCIKDTPGGQ